MKITNIAHVGQNNLGDDLCAPSLYFEGLGSPVSYTSKEPTDVAIYGGGVIYEGARIHASKVNPQVKIYWGVGHTVRGQIAHHEHPSITADLAGIRDFPIEETDTRMWVPCASCMHPLFDQILQSPPTIRRQFGRYGHHKMNPSPDLNNDCRSFEQVLTYMAESQIVITSSYHGVYWATLLGKPVICIPFGSKFMMFKHQPAYANTWNVSNAELNAYPNALQECRDANIQMNQRVKTLLSQLS